MNDLCKRFGTTYFYDFLIEYEESSNYRVVSYTQFNSIFISNHWEYHTSYNVKA